MSDAKEIEKQFDNHGHLIGERPKSGTGVFRHFGQNGLITMEGWMKSGQPLGYVKMFDVDGKTHLFTKFWIRLKYLSKKRYHALCDKDPTLPRFDEVEEYNFMAEDLKFERRRQREEAKKIQQQDNTEERKKAEAFCEKLLAEEDPKEAIEWLTNKSKGENTLGELQTNKESLQLARKLYGLGVEKVFAIKIGSDNSGENSGKLVLALPEDREKRKRIFRWSDKQARSEGFDPDVDIGQRYLFVMLD